MELSKEKCDEIRHAHILIEHYKKMVEIMETHMREVVEKAAGVDTSLADYRLDLEKGTLDAVTE